MNKTIPAILTIGVFVAVALIMLADLTGYLGRKQAFLSAPPVHGTTLVIEPDLSRTNAVAELKETLRRRFFAYGARIFWEPISVSRFRLVAPVTGTNMLATITNLISQGGHLEFCLVHEQSDQLVVSGEVPDGYELRKHQVVQPSGQEITEMVVASKKPAAGLAGDVIKSTLVTRDRRGQPAIDFELTPAAAAAFAVVTRANIGRRLAIVLDDRLFSAPRIASPIESGNGQIAGQFDDQEARLLATLMEYPLPVPVTLVEAKNF